MHDNSTENWYLDEQLWQDFYDCMFSPQHFQQAEQQIDSLLQLVGYLPEHVLDLACGPGRHSLPLAKRGCQITAIDASRYLLDQFGNKISQHGSALPINIQHQDMRRFQQAEAFDLIISMWTSFGYFEDEQDNLDVLTSCYSNLQSGGTLVLDVAGKEYLLQHLQPVHARDIDGDRLLIERPSLSDDMSRMQIEWLLIDGNSVARCEFSHSVYTGVELRDRLYAAGFDQVELFGDWHGNDYDMEAERLIAVARKI